MRTKSRIAPPVPQAGMTGPTFNGDVYNDDRMFVLCLCRCTTREDGDGTIVTTVHHDDVPEGAGWCLVTYRNTSRYPAYRVDRFDTRQEAQAYLEHVEPTVPLVSLGGRSPAVCLTYPQFVAWKREQGLREYDWRRMYEPGGLNHQETFVQSKREG